MMGTDGFAFEGWKHNRKKRGLVSRVGLDGEGSHFGVNGVDCS